MTRKFVIPMKRVRKEKQAELVSEGSVVLDRFDCEKGGVFEKRVRQRAADLQRELRSAHFDCPARVVIVWAPNGQRARIHYTVETLQSAARKVLDEDEGD